MLSIDMCYYSYSTCDKYKASLLMFPLHSSMEGFYFYIKKDASAPLKALNASS